MIVKDFQSIKFAKSKWCNIMCAFLVISNCILVALSPKYQFVFWIDYAGSYIRKPWIIYTDFCTFAPIFAASVLCLIESFFAKSATERSRYLFTAAYSLPVLGMGLAEAINAPGATSVYFGFVITFGFMFVDSLRKEITQDPLTGLMNQNAIDNRIHNLIAKHTDEPIILCVFDIDNFKRINDTYGHRIGDDVIVITAKALSSTAKKHDVAVSRIHGDEFVALMEGKSEEKAIEILNEMAQRVAADSETNGHYITVSYGMARYIKGMSQLNLFEIADRNMYEQKQLKKLAKAQ